MPAEPPHASAGTPPPDRGGDARPDDLPSESLPGAGPGKLARRGGPATLSRVAVVAVIIAAVVVVIMAFVALWSGRPDEPGPGAPAAQVVPNGQTKAFEIELGDLFVRPSSISVSYGTRVVLHVVNRGAMSHDLQLEGGRTGTGMLSLGQRTTVDYGLFGHAG